MIKFCHYLQQIKKNMNLNNWTKNECEVECAIIPLF